MYKSWSSDTIRGSTSQFGYIEMDPSGRYGRFKEILGKGASKTVYKAFDEVLAMEVAWNQVILNDVFGSPEELHRLYAEVHLLKNLNHNSIMRFYMSWIDVDRRTFNFITEMFTAGSLREYRQKYKRVHIRAVKDWARQILEGLEYLHGYNPPVIHRDLKCDNIFINGHLGQVKIGDLGLAVTLCESHHAHSVIGTPEFMAPEMYEEEYNELVDIYSFGMCVLEMLTSQYPYGECSNPAQIYKKVTTGKLPKAFYEIEDLEARRFVRKCLENASTRPSAKELLMDPFLCVENKDDKSMNVSMVSCKKPNPIQKIPEKLPSVSLDNPKKTTDMTITGTMNEEDGSIFLKVHISDETGKSRNIYFPFVIASDTAHDVATEMVKELEIDDWEPFDIAKMIDEEIANLIPTWKKGLMDSLQNIHHHESFYYDEENDDNTPHPFRSASSSSSQASPCSPFYSAISSTLDWAQGSVFNDDDDDASSQSSLNTNRYSNFTYCTNNPDKCDPNLSISQAHPHSFGKQTANFTRFCGEQRTRSTRLNDKQNVLDSNQHRKMKRVGSLVDIRSQLLHRSLVEEINKRRLFQTVDAIETIGYRKPPW